MSKRKRLSPDEQDKIVELKLQRVPVRQIATQVGCATLTVQRTWKTYLAERVRERNEDTAETMEVILAQLDQNATDARRGFQRALRDRDMPLATRYLEVERRALSELAKLGVVRDTEPEQAGKVTEAQAAAVAEVIRKASLELPVEERAAFLSAAVEQLRGLG